MALNSAIDNPEPFLYIWFWRSRLPGRKGQRCRVLARGALNTILIEFEDGFKVTTSGNGIRKREGRHALPSPRQ